VELLSRADIDGFSDPDHFFRLALDHQILTLVDLQCLEICARRAAAAPVGLDVYLNVFGSTLINVPVERILAATGALPDPRRLCLEVSEQQFFVDSSRLRARLAELRAAGIRVGLDDVGFGRTSLELLLLLAPDVVKVDRRFVTGCAADPSRLQALRRLVDVIAAIGATIIAEGVETEADRDAVAGFGIAFAQGYLWGRPQEGDLNQLAGLSPLGTEEGPS
jgi:EAL domain-containing protein (putative c-di-GMP-specific phosphodiesterase class I)